MTVNGDCEGSAPETRPRPVVEETRPVTRMVRFGWRALAGPLMTLLGFVALLVGAAGFVVDRVFAHRLVEVADWRVGAAVAAGGVLLAVAGPVVTRGAPRKRVEVRPLAFPARAWYAVFALALAASADASFRVWHDVLKVHVWEAAAFFAVVEAALLAAGLSMRVHLLKYGTPGPARPLVWLLTGFGIVAAFLVSGFPYGLWRAIGGPLASVLALHMALGVELRAEGARDRLARFSQALRSVGEHLLSYVGAGSGEQTWIVIRQQRAFARAARLASAPRLGKFGRWRYRRALRACGAGRSPEATEGLMRALAAERAADALRTLPTVSPWDGTTRIEAPATVYRRRRKAKPAESTADVQPQPAAARVQRPAVQPERVQPQPAAARVQRPAVQPERVQPEPVQRAALDASSAAAPGERPTREPDFVQPDASRERDAGEGKPERPASPPASPLRDRARAAARRHQAQHGDLPTVAQLMQLADVSRGTAGTALQELREQPAPLQLITDLNPSKANS